jgi:hypothetical protein
MDAIREQLQKPLVAGIIGGIIGLIIGWFVIGWGIWPVEYVGAGPKDMTFEAKVQYLQMALEAYGQNRDPVKAKDRYDALGPDASLVLTEVVRNPGGQGPEVVTAFSTVVLSGAAAPPVQATTEPGAVLPAAEEEPQAAGGILRTAMTVLCVVVLLVGGGAIVFFILRSRGASPTGTITPAMEAQQAARQAEYTDYVGTGSEPPMAQFMASFKVGDDLFDDSFSIDSPAGEFLGECGVGISETIGVGEPKKVTAFEVWLFDKNDIQTVTKVLMSGHAFNDETSRQRLAAKGEPVQIDPGTETVLETETLQLVARVVDMGYGDGALPPESYFDRFILELAVWNKA